MKTLIKTRLKIADQKGLLNQIAGTYKDFFRAAMEYIDNSVDAGTILAKEGKKTKAQITIEIDSDKKTVSFQDNCGGMSPEELCKLLSSVGQSSKKTVPWANGQFGFGVHAFRAFAKEATFISRKGRGKTALITIDRDIDETEEVCCVEANDKLLPEIGTKVVISRFEKHVFKKASFIQNLAQEIEYHFDDVLRNGLARIFISDGKSKTYECKAFDFTSLQGTALKKNLEVETKEGSKSIAVDLKVLERPLDDRPPLLVNKGRRVQAINDLKSYKNFTRAKGEKSYVWGNGLVVGSVEINDLCSPNLTRDDLKDSEERDKLCEVLLQVQHELDEIVNATINKKAQDSYKKISSIMSDCLSQVLKKFRLEFEQMLPSGVGVEFDQKTVEGEGTVPFGGDGPGGGGAGANEKGGGGMPSVDGSSGIGDADHGGGEGKLGKATADGQSTPMTVTTPGPRIEFQPHADADRVIDIGNSIIVNTQHPDFISRNPNKMGTARLDARLINYVSQVVAPHCIHKLFERRGKMPTVEEAVDNIVRLSLRFEQQLSATVMNLEIKTT